METLQEISETLAQGEEYLENGLINKADESYNRLRKLYKKLEKNDDDVYQQILEFYDRIK